MRLIDADALEREGWSLCRTFEKDKTTMVYEVKKPYDFPTIEERKKGKWIKEYWHGDHIRECSACHLTQTVTTYRGKVNFNYCPYCGADMRGEKE